MTKHEIYSYSVNKTLAVNKQLIVNTLFTIDVMARCWTAMNENESVKFAS